MERKEGERKGGREEGRERGRQGAGPKPGFYFNRGMQRDKPGVWGIAPSGVRWQIPWSGGQGAKLFSSWMAKGNGKSTPIFLFYDFSIIQQMLW